MSGLGKSSQEKNCRHEKTASLNLEKDTSKHWNLARVLNEKAPSHSETVLCVHNKLLTNKKATNKFV